MPLAAKILAVLAALIHVYFFYLESVAWTKPSTWKIFGLKSQEEAETTKSLALNQGYYNLFLAIGVIVGVVIDANTNGFVTLENADKGLFYGGEAADTLSRGGAVVVFGLACMLGAAAVLLISSKGKMLRGALIQGLLPLAGLLIIAVA